MLPVSKFVLYGFVAASAIVALFAAVAFRVRIGREGEGTEEMKRIAGKIREGAMAFLLREYSVIVPFMVIAAILIYLFLDVRIASADVLHSWTRPFTAVSFLLGAFLSGLSGFIGMRCATAANVRTAHAARTSLPAALRISFLSGATMGCTVVGLALLGFIAVLYITETIFVEIGGIRIALDALTGFGFGASCVALFARVGGGIYTKAADVGADLVGKIEAGIPEDDPRNPAVIADNVGDNVGDVAGMGADLYESFVGAILATMLVGLTSKTLGLDAAQLLFYPLLLAAVGIVASLLAMAFVRTARPDGVQNALKGGMVIASVFFVIAAYGVTYFLFRDQAQAFLPASNRLFYAVVCGLLAGVGVGLLTEYYTSHHFSPVRRLADTAKTGPATVLIEGLALGYGSTALPTLVIIVAMGIAYIAAGMYGVGVGAVGMLATLAMTLAIDAFGPVADNAGGIAEMAHLPPEVRERTDALDAAGNTTAAIGKGFAIGVAGFMVLALFAAFKEQAHLEVIDVSDAFTIIGLLIGGMLPFLFSALTMRAVGRAAMGMVEEVRRQFKEIPGLMEGTAEGDTARCVSISTAAAIKQMVAPGLLAMLSPIAVGLLLGLKGIGGLLAGALVSSIMLGLSMANSGGAWDNAKKYIEAGNLGGKRSDPHKAAVVGDTVGDPFKDTSGPSLNILVKLMTIVSVLTAGLYSASGLLGIVQNWL